MPSPNRHESAKFHESEKGVVYLRDVQRLVATDKRQQRHVLGGEIINDEDQLRRCLAEKLGMQSTNVKKAFKRIDRDHSGALDKYEFRKFLESLNITVTQGCFTRVFNALDSDGSGTVEFNEFMTTFGPAIAGDKMESLLDGKPHKAEQFEALNKIVQARADRNMFTAEEAGEMLTKKMACMSGSCRRIFALANSDFTTHEDVDAGAEGGLSMNEFMTLLIKFNIPISAYEMKRLWSKLDPDGSGVLTYGEFIHTFGDAISGGGGSMRWGMCAIPVGHPTAKKFTNAAEAAERYAAGPAVQSGGQIVEDGLSGSSVQREQSASDDHLSDYEREMMNQKALEAAALAQANSGPKMPKYYIPGVTSRNFDEKTGRDDTGRRKTKADFLLERRQLRESLKPPRGFGSTLGNSSPSKKSSAGSMLGSPDLTTGSAWTGTNATGKLSVRGARRQTTPLNQLASLGSSLGLNRPSTASSSRMGDRPGTGQSGRPSTAGARGNSATEAERRLRDKLKTAERSLQLSSRRASGKLASSRDGGGAASGGLGSLSASVGRAPMDRNAFANSFAVTSTGETLKLSSRPGTAGGF